MSEELVQALRNTVQGKLNFEPGTVIKFNSTSRRQGAEQKFNYAAILADDRRWYLTGVNKHYGDRITTTEFLEVLKHDDVSDIALATDWQDI